MVFGWLATGEPTGVFPSYAVESDSDDEFDPAPQSIEELAELLQDLDSQSDEDIDFDSDSEDADSDEQ